jgi:hypothetical protein
LESLAWIHQTLVLAVFWLCERCIVPPARGPEPRIGITSQKKGELQPHSANLRDSEQVANKQRYFSAPHLYAEKEKEGPLMRLKWFALPMLAMASGVVSSSPSKAFAAVAQGYVQDQAGWDTPPAEFRDIQRQGFHDGIEGARKDFDHHRMPDVNNREEYKHPHVDPAARMDYQDGFRRGYEVAMHHLMGQVPQ